MKRTLQGLLVLTLAVVLAMPAMAAEEKKKKKKKGRKAPVAVKVPKSIVLTPVQKKQVAEMPLKCWFTNLARTVCNRISRCFLGILVYNYLIIDVT